MGNPHRRRLCGVFIPLLFVTIGSEASVKAIIAFIFAERTD